jgi:hypothetical protein
MDKAMNKVLKFQDSEVGWTAGYWEVAEGGYAWNSELRLMPFGDVEGDFGLRLPPGYEGPWLHPKGTMRRRYSVLKERRVLHEFVQLGKAPQQAKILEFANRWGWLGDQFPIVDKSSTMLTAEPLALWEEECRLLVALWETWQAVLALSKRGVPIDEHNRARALLQDRVTWQSSNSVVFSWPDPVMGSDLIMYDGRPEGPTVLSRWEQGDTLEPARYYIHKKVNKCLAGHVQMAVLPFQTSKIRFAPDNLRTALYMHFAFELAGIVGQERTCENPRCPNGGVFLPSRRDQRNCDKNCREMAGYYRRHKED